jgi:hypothetical protein
MDNDEIKRRIVSRIDKDRDFAGQLGAALEVGAWEIIAQLISDAVGFVIRKAGELWDWLKNLF